MILADTDVLLDFLAGADPGASRVQIELEHGQLFTTAINRFELLSGSRSARQTRLIRQLLDALPCAAIDDATADQAADLHRILAQAGNPLSMNCCLIGTVALRNKAQILTRDAEAFAGIPDVAFAAFAAGE